MVKYFEDDVGENSEAKVNNISQKCGNIQGACRDMETRDSLVRSTACGGLHTEASFTTPDLHAQRSHFSVRKMQKRIGRIPATAISCPDDGVRVTPGQGYTVIARKLDA
jgi:hypothetical protein